MANPGSDEVIAQEPLFLTAVIAGPPIYTNWSITQATLPGDYDPSKTFIQSVPQSVTTIHHGLEFKPGGVSLFSLDGGMQYEGFSVQHLDDNNLRISMDTPTAFMAIMS